MEGHSRGKEKWEQKHTIRTTRHVPSAGNKELSRLPGARRTWKASSECVCIEWKKDPVGAVHLEEKSSSMVREFGVGGGEGKRSANWSGLGQ